MRNLNNEIKKFLHNFDTACKNSYRKLIVHEEIPAEN
jgi:hypothetical protein